GGYTLRVRSHRSGLDAPDLQGVTVWPRQLLLGLFNDVTPALQGERTQSIMLGQYLAVIWQWISTAFVKLLAVWFLVTLVAIVWVRLTRISPDDAPLASPKREAILSLFVM